MATISYNDAWLHDKLSDKAKLRWLDEGAEAGDLTGAIPVERDWLDDMRPTPFLNGQLVSIAECFGFKRSGIQTKRDEFVYSTSVEKLESRIKAFLSAGEMVAAATFHDSRDRQWASAKEVKYSTAHVVQAAYRPFDRRWLYNHRRYGDFLRPELQEVWGSTNIGFYAMPGGTGAGPAVWCHGLLPDYHAFRGSYGGYAFPLYDRRPDHGPLNIRTSLIEALGIAYGEAVSPEAVFDAMLGLLSATSYTTVCRKSGGCLPARALSFHAPAVR